jgi:hypothetical protein
MLGIWVIYKKTRFLKPVIKYLCIALLFFQILSLIEQGLIFYEIKSAPFIILSKELMLFVLTGILFYATAEHDSSKQQ